MLVVDVKVKRVVGVVWVMRMTAQGFFPADDLAHIFNDGFALGKVGQCKHAFAMHARATGLDASACDGRSFGCFGAGVFVVHGVV